MNSLNFCSVKETEKAWLAGFIDGEGYIGITRQKKKANRQQSASIHYHSYLIITNNNREILEKIKELLGVGYVYEIHQNRKHHKQSFQYKLTEMKKLNALLSLIRPYLHLKQKQCSLLLDFINLRGNAKRIYGPFRGATSYTIEEKIYQKLLILNKRGVL